MELVKKNILSIICGMVALIAVVASFVPLGGYIQTLQQDLDKSKSAFGTLEGLRTKPRNLPTLSLEEAAPQPLGMFPSKEVIDKARGVTKEVEAQSVRMRDAAIAMNKRPPLVPRALPNPGSSDEITFRNAYHNFMMPARVGELPPILQKFNAGQLPKPEEITRMIAAKREEINQTQVIRNPQGQVANQQEITELLADAERSIPATMRKNVAEQKMFYIEPTTLDVAPGFTPGPRAPSAVPIWWAQVALWVQLDVLNAVTEMNTAKLADGTTPDNLMEAPIKRLTKVAVPVTNSFVTVAGAAGAAPAAAPATGDPLAAADAAITKAVYASPTGRASNGMYDVVQFKIDLDMEVDKIPAFLRTLSHNRLMTAYQVDVKMLDAEQYRLMGYFYGDKPVAAVTLSCEALLLRYWTIDLMPRLVRQGLGIPDAPAPAAPAAPAQPQAMAQ